MGQEFISGTITTNLQAAGISSMLQAAEKVDINT